MDDKNEKGFEIIDFNEPEDNDKKPKKPKWKGHLIRSVAALVILTSLYLTAVYSNIPFIEKWRTIYIETAMSTTSHKWLATWFIPKSVIDEVMAKKQKELDAQKNLNTVWKDETETETETETEDKEKEAQETFFKKYWELDSYSFKSYLEKNPSLTVNGYDSILIEDLDYNLGLQTTNGDKVLVVDTANNLMIIGVSGEGFVGKLAVVKDSSQIDLVKSASFGSYGQEASTFGANYNALLVINASGFKDVGGHGSGGTVKGSMVMDGVEMGNPMGGYWKVAGLKKNNKLYVANYDSSQTSEFRWAVEFFPGLIINGQNVVDGTFGMGIQPRTAIGQTETGDFLMLIVDGRQVGYSLGCTVADCADILAGYKACQASNLDGGSSSVMWYRGNLITKSSSVSGRGRYMPNALIVNPAKK